MYCITIHTFLIHNTC